MQRGRDNQEGEPRPGRLQQEPPESRARAPEASVTRNPHGQSLDDAREAFRAEWQAKIDQKRRRAASAARLASDLRSAARMILTYGTAVGALGGCMVGVAAWEISVLLLAVPLLAVSFFAVSLIPATALFVCAWLSASHADDLEQEARKLELADRWRR